MKKRLISISIILLLIAGIVAVNNRLERTNAALVDSGNITDIGIYIYTENGIVKVSHNAGASIIKTTQPIDIIQELNDLQTRVSNLEKLLKVN